MLCDIYYLTAIIRWGCLELSEEIVSQDTSYSLHRLKLTDLIEIRSYFKTFTFHLNCFQMRLQIFIPLQATRAAHFSDQHLQSKCRK